jgi:hypothetical protein
MNRKQKIELLQAIKDGKVGPEILLPPQVYFFNQLTTNPNTYEMKGKIYSEKEYQDFIDRIENKKSVVWHEAKQYEDIIVTMTKEPD